ncbi:DNA mismatch repair protein MutT [Neoasaia chiangmaiensis]|uniref:Uncharacterized protein n=1 Tax=Neoasaia chiangmaiensis TaxID=320497 RepID=A0A1U9KSF9_9PROT|nr:NUDIX domain-containing protein [Neoasaia chiangmaiensis]AQS88814.1 hypothetical protein A0U93_13750 [Neoasaia chiangmaiensis]GEN13777.1 DNA mismatch repair protein MutT [Neoasaia chiangmaiensis]
MTEYRHIHIAAGVIRDRNGRMLLVRKEGTAAFMQPGGKIDGREDSVQALIRELDEELALTVAPAELTPLGIFEAPAANEPGHVVRATLFGLRIDGTPMPRAEIAEAIWIDPKDPGDIVLAPLTRDYVLPMGLM